MSSAGGVVPQANLFYQTLSEGSFFKEHGITDLNKFKELIHAKLRELHLPDTRENILQTGGIILQGFIRNKLHRIDIPQKTKERLAYFGSDAFIENFSVSLPVVNSIEKGRKGYAYSSWFNLVFNAKYDDWRHKLSTTAAKECGRAIGDEGSICYLCGLEINTRSHDTKECEHILPFISGICHLSLANRTDEYTENQNAILKLEYGWSHRCCNQLKTDYEFIIIDRNRLTYIVNLPLIRDYYELLKTEFGKDKENIPKYDCFKINIQTEKLHEREQILILTLKKITEYIHSNIQQLGDIHIYELLIKFKIVSAFSDPELLDVLKGTGSDRLTNKNRSKLNKFKETALSEKLALPVYSPEEAARKQEEQKFAETGRAREERDQREIERLKVLKGNGLKSLDEDMMQYLCPSTEPRKCKYCIEEKSRAKPANQKNIEIYYAMPSQDYCSKHNTNILSIMQRGIMNFPTKLSNWWKNISSSSNKPVEQRGGAQGNDMTEPPANTKNKAVETTTMNERPANKANTTEVSPENYFNTYLYPLTMPIEFLIKIGFTEGEIDAFISKGFIGPDILTSKFTYYILTNYSITEENFNTLYSEFQASKEFAEYQRRETNDDRILNTTSLNTIIEHFTQAEKRQAEVFPSSNSTSKPYLSFNPPTIMGKMKTKRPNNTAYSFNKTRRNNTNTPPPNAENTMPGTPVAKRLKRNEPVPAGGRRNKTKKSKRNIR